jgi:hypothetical protein
MLIFLLYGSQGISIILPVGKKSLSQRIILKVNSQTTVSGAGDFVFKRQADADYFRYGTL